VTNTDTPLVGNRFVDGQPKLNDGVGRIWTTCDCPISASKFRNVGANLLEEHETYARYADYFLGHSPKSLKERHYAVPSQAIFDAALDWLRQRILGK
jgi:hypothetical protein